MRSSVPCFIFLASISLLSSLKIVSAHDLGCPKECFCCRKSPFYRTKIFKKCATRFGSRCGKCRNGIKFRTTCENCTQCERHQKMSVEWGDNVIVKCLSECENGYYWDAVTIKCNRCSKCRRGVTPIPVEPECEKQKPRGRKVCSKLARKPRRRNRVLVVHHPQTDKMETMKMENSVVEYGENLAVNSGRDEIVNLMAKFMIAILVLLILVTVLVGIFQIIVISRAKKLLLYRNDILSEIQK